MAADPIPLRPGLSPAPARRKTRKAALKALPAQFISDIAADWERHGPQVLAFLRQRDTATYVRVVSEIARHLTPRPEPEPRPRQAGCRWQPFSRRRAARTTGSWNA